VLVRLSSSADVLPSLSLRPTGELAPLPRVGWIDVLRSLSTVAAAAAALVTSLATVVMTTNDL